MAKTQNGTRDEGEAQSFGYVLQTGSPGIELLAGVVLILVGALLVLLVWALGFLLIFGGTLVVLGGVFVLDGVHRLGHAAEKRRQYDRIAEHYRPWIEEIRALKERGGNPIPFLVERGITDGALRQALLKEARAAQRRTDP